MMMTQTYSTLQAYSEFAPTAFDHKGAFLPERRDWLVGPCSQTRDSGSLERSNYASLLKALEDAGDEDYEDHRFGHWGPGWYEIVLVRPGSKAADLAEEIGVALQDYPVVDEMHLSETEHYDQCEAWDGFYREEFRCKLEDRFDDGDADLDDVSDSALHELFHGACETSNTYWESDSGGQGIDVTRVAAAVTKEQIWTLPGFKFDPQED